MDIISSTKLAVASTYGYGLNKQQPYSPACEALKAEGLYLAPSLLDQDRVDRLNAACDRIYDQYPGSISMESNGSDARIYGVDRLSNDSIFKELQEQFLADAQIFYNSRKIEQFCMAGTITYHPEGLGSGSGWHRDSPYRHQFKVIIYLSDTTLEEGPFEFIPDSHHKSSLVKSAQCLGKPLAADRYTNQEVEQLLEQGAIRQPFTLVGPAGTTLYADTRGLHRGRPLEKGRRRAVTFYVYHNAMPSHFSDVLAELPLV